MQICVLGMHRSGTSLLMQLLHACGVETGDEAWYHRARIDNLTGYWEHPRFQRLNEALLDWAGGSWKTPPPIDVSWRSEDRHFLAIEESARSLIATFDHPVWGWKDPRNTLTYPFWLRLLGEPRAVVMLRDPLEVAASLEARLHRQEGNAKHGLPFDRAIDLWQRYNLGVERLLGETSDALLVHYDALLAWPADELRRVVSELGLPVSDRRLEEAARISNPALSRSGGLISPDAVAGEEIDSLYHRLCGLAGPIHRELRELAAPGGSQRLRHSSAAVTSPGAAADPARGAGTIEDLDVAVVHYRHSRPTVAMLTSLFRHYPEVRVTLVDNSGGRCAVESEVLPHLPWYRERIRVIRNPARDHGPAGGLSHGAGLDLALERCRARYLVTMEADTFVLERGPLEFLLALMAAGYAYGGVGQKPVDGVFASFSPSFAIFEADLLRESGLSFRRRPRPVDERADEDPLTRHHREAAERIRAGLPPSYPEGKSPGTYRRGRQEIVERELGHLDYFDTGEWIHRALLDAGHQGQLFPPPQGVRHVWNSADEGAFLENFRLALPDLDVNDLLPPALRVSLDLEPLPLPCLDLVDAASGEMASRWSWSGGTADAPRVRGDRVLIDLSIPEGDKRYLSLGSGGFGRPPAPGIGATIAGSSLHRIGCRMELPGTARASLIVVEYSSRERLGDHHFSLSRGARSFWFTTGADAVSFRILFRFTGHGPVSLGGIELAGRAERKATERALDEAPVAT